MLITYKGCVICSRYYTVHSNYILIGTYKTLAAAKAAATREDNKRKQYYNAKEWATYED